MDKATIAGLVRHLLTTLGGVGFVSGNFSATEWETLAGGLAVLAGVIWSVWQKKKG